MNVHDFVVTGMFDDGVIEVHRISTDEYKYFNIGSLLKKSNSWEED